MNANPTLNAPAPKPVARRPLPATSATETLPVPARWRIGQLLLIALVALGAIVYNVAFVPWKFLFQTLQASNFKAALGLFSLSDQLGFVLLAAMIWLCTPAAATVAVATLQEALRRRWVIGFLLFSTIVLACSGMLTFVQLGEEQRFLQDMGTGFIIGMTILIAIFLGVTLVPPEIERRTIFTILSKPVNRLEFLLGKFYGLALTLFVCLAWLSAVFLTVFILFNLKENPAAWTTGTANNPDANLGFQTANLAKALLLHYGQLIVFVGVVADAVAHRDADYGDYLLFSGVLWRPNVVLLGPSGRRRARRPRRRSGARLEWADAKHRQNRLLRLAAHGSLRRAPATRHR